MMTVKLLLFPVHCYSVDIKKKLVSRVFWLKKQHQSSRIRLLPAKLYVKVGITLQKQLTHLASYKPINIQSLGLPIDGGITIKVDDEYPRHRHNHKLAGGFVPALTSDQYAGGGTLCFPGILPSLTTLTGSDGWSMVCSETRPHIAS